MDLDKSHMNSSNALYLLKRQMNVGALYIKSTVLFLLILKIRFSKCKYATLHIFSVI